MTPDQTAQKPVGFLDLPTEVRHQVYKYLFCHRALPIPLGSGSLAPLQLQDKIDLDEPVFHTALFRVNKDISADAIRFAYSANSFQLPSELASFCRLSSTALASIRSLTVYNNCWLVGREFQAVWDIINHRCSSLTLLVIQPSTHLLWQAIPQLKKYVAEFDGDKASRPKIVFHLYVFDRHFSLDLPEREYQRALQELKGAEGGHDGWYGFLRPREMIALLPRHVKQINCVLDVSAGGIRALDEAIRDSADLPLVKMSLPTPTKTFRHGCRAQLCYVWGERIEV
ncbi:hypothetical protein RBB50_008096 [Rhinocladiella similis]